MQGFPQHVLTPGQQLWRIHKSTLGPWYFRSDGTFRFDLVGRAGHGTCYFAEDPLGAFVETLRGFRAVSIPRIELRARQLYAYSIRHALVLADATDDKATRYEVDAAISASKEGDYEASQEFARLAFDNGFAGIRYHLRNKPKQNLIGVALFGPAGSQPDDLLEGEGTTIDEDLIVRACVEASFRTQGPLLDPVEALPGSR